MRLFTIFKSNSSNWEISECPTGFGFQEATRKVFSLWLEQPEALTRQAILIKSSYRTSRYDVVLEKILTI